MTVSGIESWGPDASIDVLRVRAGWLKKIRRFFEDRAVLEVETPVLAATTVPDPNIESLSTRYQGQTYYLQTSPEFYMKRLLAAGSGAIYQLGRVFRDDEAGRWHHPEFTLLEWYRPGFDQQALMNEVADMVMALYGETLPFERTTYRDLFLRYVGIDPLQKSWPAVAAYCREQSLECPLQPEEDWDTVLDWLLSCVIQPQMQGFCFVYDYPASQASLAQLNPADPLVARRFELYIEGIEIANGFEELTDSAEQRERFNRENRQRCQRRQKEIPLDEKFLRCLDNVPATSGVAMGFDRLLMLAMGVKNVSDTMAYAWQSAADPS